MPVYDIMPLAPACLLLLGALLFPTLGQLLAARYRRWTALSLVVLSLICLLALFFVHPSIAAGEHFFLTQGRSVVLTDWLHVPGLVLHPAIFNVYSWALVLSLLAMLSATRKWSLATVHTVAALFAIVATGCLVVLSGNIPLLAVSLFAFDGAVAVLFLALEQPELAVRRLLLAVLSAGAIMVLSQLATPAQNGTIWLGSVFSFVIWLRIGLYPLFESRTATGSPGAVGAGWLAVNLVVSLYLLSTGVAGWIVWPMVFAVVVHGLLAWLEPARGRALVHAVHAMAGIVVTAVAVGGPSAVYIEGDYLTIGAAALLLPLALLALAVTPHRLGPLLPGKDSHDAAKAAWRFVPPAFATLALLGLPATLGALSMDTAYGRLWAAGRPLVGLLVTVGLGAAWAALYRYWRHLVEPARDGNADGVQKLELGAVGAAIAVTPFLIPLAGKYVLDRLYAGGGSAPANVPSSGAWLGLVGALLLGLLLGYGRTRLMAGWPLGRPACRRWLRLEWLLGRLADGASWLGRIILRVRFVVEGEHYLAWAIFFLLCTGLLVLVYAGDIFN